MSGLSSGTFTRAYDFTNDRDSGIKIRADRVDAEIDAIATALSTALYRDGQATPNANLPMGGYKITNLGIPTQPADAASKTYVDGLVTSPVNATVRVASTANVTKASAMDNGKTIDGTVLATNDRVLLKNQSSAAENGVWVVAASGAPARATDFDTFAEHVGSIVNVTAGSANAGFSFRCTVNAGGTLDSTSITYVQFGTTISTPISLANGGTGVSLSDPGVDSVPFFDESAGGIAYLVPNNGLAIVGTGLGLAISGLSEDTSPDGSSDLVVTYDNSASGYKKVKPNTLLGLLNGLTEDTTPDTAADFALTYDTSATAPKKVKLSNLTGITAGGWTQIGGTTSTASGASVAITSIPSGYRQLVLRLNAVEHNDNSLNRGIQVELSSDNGSGYGSPMRVTPQGHGDQAVKANGAVVIDAVGDTGIPKSVLTAVGAAFGSTTYYVPPADTVTTGVINALRVSPEGGASFDGGSFTLWGVK